MRRVLTAILAFAAVLSISTGAGRSAPIASTVNITVSVDAATGVHTISPLIYGVAFASGAFLQGTNLTLDRWGGNATTRYNWKLNAENSASDWYFENHDSGGGCTGTAIPSCAADLQIAGDRTAHAASDITIPTIGWVAKNGNYDSCGFPVSEYEAQQNSDPDHPTCGNGVSAATGKELAGTHPTDTSVSVGPAYMAGWVNHLAAKFGTAANGGVRFYSMDNEPELWYTTHRDVAPNPLTYTGEYNRFINYATAVKGADSGAQIMGPESWGWDAYFDSSYDYVHNTTVDKTNHGGLDFIPWFLQTVKTHDTQTGKRSLDVLDLHYYPQGNGVFGGATDPATNALRLRETRSLWDPAYTDESWINAKVNLLPRMKAWVAQNYPGTKVGLSEWNFGADGTMNGAIAIANVLGTLGKQGIYSSTYWTHPAAGTPGQLAFKMYRNYDGQKHTFGDRSIAANSSASGALMAFGSLRSSTGQMLLMLVNQSPTNAAQTTINFANFAPAGSVSVYQYNSTNLEFIVHRPDVPAANPLSVTVPPYTIELLVINHV